MNYQWYPGHMTKAKRMMEENIKLIDLLIELVDARVPISGRNPDIDELGKNKFRMILLNKTDLADDKLTEKWHKYYEDKGYFVIEINARLGNGMKGIDKKITEVCAEKIERDRKRGIIGRPIRAMVVGIPNVGKSTFINSFAGKACTKTGNKPGVTKGKQWIKINNRLELLDTPGILWPKFDNNEIGMKLAFIGSMNDEVLSIEELSLELIRTLNVRYPKALVQRYQIDADINNDIDILTAIGRERKCLLKGDEVDLFKTSNLLLDDFRSGRCGKITLEDPEELGNE